MPTFFGKILGGLGIGKNALPSFPSTMGSGSRIGILAPAQSVGIVQQPSQLGILNPANDTLGVGAPKTSVFESILNGASTVLDIASSAKELVSKIPDVNGGELPEVTVTATKPNFIENIKTAVGKVADGKPVVSMGQEFSIADNLKIPLYIGLGLLAYKVFKGGR